MMYCDLGSLMEILLCIAHERLKYLTVAINRSGVIEIEFNLELKSLLICAVIKLAPEQFSQKILKTFFRLPLIAKNYAGDKFANL